MSRRVSCEVSSVNISNEQQVDKQATEGVEYETVNRKDKAVLTPIGDVRYHLDDSTKVTLQQKTSQKDMKQSTQSFRRKLDGSTYIRDSMTQRTSIEHLSTTKKILNETMDIRLKVANVKVLKQTISGI